MTLRKISDASIVISLFRYFYKWYGYIENKLMGIFHNSQTYRLAKGFYGGVKICFRYSFLGRITETRQTASGILDNSRTVRSLINYYNKWNDKIIHYFKASSTIDLAKNTKEQLDSSPVKIISIIIVTAITINVLLSIALQKQIGLWGWLMRALFLFGAVSGLFCKANWQTIKRSSVCLRKMRID